jgi:LAO/AO transport system kinase
MAKSSPVCEKSWDLDVRSLSPEIPPALAALVDRLRRGEAAALSRCLSLVEQGGAQADVIGRLANPATGRAAVVGFSGPPGAGKSTLIDVYIARVRAGGRSVAVAAVDPSSPISGGSVLGDRVRMERHSEDPGVFIRSIASRGHLGGLSESIHRVVDLMDAAGRDVIVVETVGAGQSEVEIAEVADVCVVVNAPNLGDDVQAIKAGLLEIADVLVVNKADLPLASRTADQLRAMLMLRTEQRDVPVIETIATSGVGVDALAAAVEARTNLSPEKKRASRLTRVRRLIAQTAGRQIRDRVLALDAAASDKILQAVLEGHCGVGAAVDRLLRLLV